MKKTVFFNLLFAAIYCMSSQATPLTSTPKVKEHHLNTQNEDAIKSFFDSYLNRQTISFNINKRIKNKDIENTRSAIWKLWKEANKDFDEEKFPAMGKLSEGKASRWILPSNLEPHAIMPFYWGTKGDSKPEEGYPLFLYLHGSGPKDAEWKTGLSICQQFDDSPSAYFIPQIPNMGEYYRWWQKSKQFAWERLLRQALITDNINPNRLYIFGISEGGYGSQRLASFYADYWAAAGPMAGGEPLKNAPVENCGNIAFSLRTGAKDYGFYRNMLTAYVKQAFDSLQQIYPQQYVHKIELIPNRGHSIDYRPTTPWLKQYIRNPYPKHFCWENFEMDGLYRNGFYNIYVQERSNADNKTRTYYEMTIEGNHIDLKINEVTYRTIQTDPQWGIELKFIKEHQPAQKGKITLYLCDELVDLNKAVTVTVNGKKFFKGKIKANLKNMVNSCATFFDPERIYPAAIDIDLSDIQ